MQIRDRLCEVEKEELRVIAAKIKNKFWLVNTFKQSSFLDLGFFTTLSEIISAWKILAYYLLWWMYSLYSLGNNGAIFHYFKKVFLHVIIKILMKMMLLTLLTNLDIIISMKNLLKKKQKWLAIMKKKKNI